MMVQIHEVHVERMLSQRVRDADGHVLGRLEEMRVEIVDGEHCVVEFHVGAGAMIERVASFVRQLPFFRGVPGARSAIRIPWQLLDLSDPNNLRVSATRRELRELQRKDRA